jgi:invasion protein IalB
MISHQFNYNQPEGSADIMAIARNAFFVFTAFGLTAAYAQAPQRVTAKFDDWTVSCTMGSSQVGEKTCEMVQVQIMENQPNPVGQITVSRPAKNQPFKIHFQVQANVWLQTGVKFTAAPNESQLAAEFRWCLPNRCLADAILPEASINKLRSLSEPGREDYKDAAQHDVSLSVSFKGLAPALDWMEKQ